MDLNLTPEERVFVKTFETKFSLRARFTITLDKLLRDWERFIPEVEQGYAETVDDYTNDLWTRDLLQEMLNAAPEKLQRKLRGLLRPLDARFRRATCRDYGHRLSEFASPQKGWWWSRLPLKLVDSMAIGLGGPRRIY